MKGALIILAALVLVGTILYLLHRRDEKKEAKTGSTTPVPDTDNTTDTVDSECCGMHITCEKDSLLTAMQDEVVYYDDEELDAYRGREPEEYSDEEIEQFRDVLLTLLPHDIAGWARSIQMRGIELPSPVRDELLLIVREAREQAIKK